MSFAHTSRAATLQFDSDGMGTPPGGPGIWDVATGTSNWYNGTSYTNWTSPADEAVFSGEAGTIYVKGPGATAAAVHYTAPGTSYQLNTTGSTFAFGGPIDVSGSNLFVLSTTSGTNLVKTGTGTLAFYAGSGGVPTGTWDINAGTIALKTDGAGVTGRIINLNGASTVFDLGHTTINSNALNGSGTVRFGSNIVVGTVDGGRYRFNIDNSSSTFSGNFTGMGRAEKTGTGIITLNGTIANTFTGQWTITGGMVINGNNDQLPDAWPIFVQTNSTLTINNNETIGSLGSASPLSSGSAIVVGGGTLSIGSSVTTAGNNQYPGAFQGSGLIKKIGNNVQLLATNGATGAPTGSSYTGKWEVDGGLLAIAPTVGDAILGPDPGAPTPDYITINGGTFAGSLTSGGSATMAMIANRGITVGASGGALSEYSSSIVSSLTVNGSLTGSASLTKGGNAVVLVNSDNAATYSGAWNVIDGALGTGIVADTSSPFGTGAVNLTGSALEILPGVSPNTTPTVNVGNVTYGAGAQLQVNKGTNTFATAQLNSLTRGTDGSLMILAASSVANLGGISGEHILVTGGVSNVNDMVPGVVGFTGAASNTADFLHYDNTFGFVPPTYSSTDVVTSASATDTVNQTGAGVLGTSKAINGIRVGGVALDLGANTLTIGSGASPATVILNPASTLSNGKVDFGGRPAIVYVAPTANPTTGVTFSGATSFTKAGSGTLTVDRQMSYSGKTYISSGNLQIGVNDAIPTTSDLVLSGSSPLNSVGTLALNGFTQNINTLNGTLQGQLDFGVNGVLKINGSGSSAFNGGAANGTGATSSTLWNAGTGTITLGRLSNPPSSGGVGLQGKTFSYNKLWLTNGGTVVANNSSYFPAASTTGLVPDAYVLDNGSVLEVGTSQLSSASISAAAASATSLTGFNRGINIGAGGGNIRVTHYEEILIAQGGNDTVATNTASIITGAGTLTKSGAGIFRVGYGNINFAGKWVVDGGGLQFQTDAWGTGSSANTGSSLGAAPGALLVDGITLKNGGFLQSNNEGAIHPNRGITVGTGGGTLYGSSGLILNSPVTGSGLLTIAGPTTSQNIDFEAANPTLPPILINTGFVAFNSDTSGGTITLDPYIEKISLGKHEGGDSTISNNINILSGGVVDLRVASTTVGLAGSILNGSSTGTLTIAGKISGPGSFFKGYDTSNGGNTLDGTVIFSNNTNDFTGNLTINFGTVVAAASNALGSSVGHTQVGPLGTLSVRNNINSPERVYTGGIILNTDNNTFSGAMQMTGDTTIDTTLTGTSVASSLKLAAGISGVHTLTKNGVGTGRDLEVQNIRASALTVNAGKVTVTPNSGATGVSTLRNPNGTALSVSGTLLDLTDNKLILSDSNSPTSPSTTTGTWDSGSSMYTGVTGLVATARNGGGWAGTSGITTSQTLATTGNYTSIGVATASDVRPATATATGLWAGQTITGTDTLVMYTYGGDATLDGKINIDDYVKIDSGIASHLTGWANGDFNYDGVVNIDDYTTVIDANIGNQNGVFFTAGGVVDGGGVSGVSAVPEPASLTILGLGAMGLMGSRRRRRGNATA